MAKTVTVRIDDGIYEKIRSAAESEKRSISNYMEYATLSYIESSNFVTDEEMRDIEQNTNLLASLEKSLEDVKQGRYKIVD